MEKIRAADLADLPITDPVHVAKEINWWRRYNEANQSEQKRRSIYMQVYLATHKNKQL
jgi:hypothetical protein